MMRISRVDRLDRSSALADPEPEGRHNIEYATRVPGLPPRGPERHAYRAGRLAVGHWFDQTVSIETADSDTPVRMPERNRRTQPGVQSNGLQGPLQPDGDERPGP